VIHCRKTYGGIHVESPTKPKPEVYTIANAQDKDMERDPIALAKRRSRVESEDGIAKMSVHPLAQRKEMSPKAERPPKAITIAREFIHCRSTSKCFTKERSEQLIIVVFLGIVLTFGTPFRLDPWQFSEKPDADNSERDETQSSTPSITAA
jgi:hypothetical protein